MTIHDPDEVSTTKRPSGWIGTTVNPGRVRNAPEKADTITRYCPSRSGRDVVSDQWPVSSACVVPAVT